MFCSSVIRNVSVDVSLVSTDDEKELWRNTKIDPYNYMITTVTVNILNNVCYTYN